jgi:hypothetical protein
MASLAVSSVPGNVGLFDGAETLAVTADGAGLESDLQAAAAPSAASTDTPTTSLSVESLRTYADSIGLSHLGEDASKELADEVTFR